MTDHQTIIAAYERHERAQGGLANANVKMCIELAAEALHLPVRDVREVLSEHWSGLGA